MKLINQRSCIDIGERIQNLRKERNWTQDKLAKMLGVSAAAVHQWEYTNQFYKGISLNSAIRLAHAFGMTVSEFIQEKKIIKRINE